MGMYDEIICNYPLPDEEVRGNRFQTKDLECAMLEYAIANGAWLFKLSDWKDGNIVTLEKPEIVKYTGSVNFYTWLDNDIYDPDRLYREWYEYQAYFVKGKLKSIEVIQVPNKEDR